VQFTLTGVFVLMAGSALVFGAFKLLGLSPQASLFVTGLIACALLAGGALVAAIAKSAGDDQG
jgi:hypothetical protein